MCKICKTPVVSLEILTTAHWQCINMLENNFTLFKSDKLLNGPNASYSTA